MIDYKIKFILIFLLGVVLSFILTKLVMLLARKLNILDHPTRDRKIHSQATPLLGGWAIYGSFALIVLLLWQTGQLIDQQFDIFLIGWLLIAGLILMINGFLDDKFSWKPRLTIWGPIIASFLMIVAGLKISHITSLDGGILYLDQLFAGLGPIFVILLTFAWLLGMTYTTKFLDGIDGLASSIGLITSLVIFFVSLTWNASGSAVSLLALALAGSLLGFLLWNWHPAKVFLGESGSVFIGFSLGALAIISGSKIATALLVMGLPVLDILWVILRRIKQRRPIWKGDQNHLHFRLLALGLSQRQIVFFISFVSLLFGLVSIFFTTKTKIGALSILLILMFVLSGWLNYRLKSE